MHAREEKNSLQIELKTIRILGMMYSRSWAHNLSARMGLEVRGAKMNPSRRTASQANDDLNIGHRVYVAMTVLWYCLGLTISNTCEYQQHA